MIRSVCAKSSLNWTSSSSSNSTPNSSNVSTVRIWNHNRMPSSTWARSDTSSKPSLQTTYKPNNVNTSNVNSSPTNTSQLISTNRSIWVVRSPLRNNSASRKSDRISSLLLNLRSNVCCRRANRRSYGNLRSLSKLSHASKNMRSSRGRRANSSTWSMCTISAIERRRRSRCLTSASTTSASRSNQRTISSLSRSRLMKLWVSCALSKVSSVSCWMAKSASRCERVMRPASSSGL